jgi:hypothetical protein
MTFKTSIALKNSSRLFCTKPHIFSSGLLTAQDISSSQTHDTQETPPSTDLNDFKMEVLSLIRIMGRKTKWAFKCIYKNTTVEQVHYTSSIIDNQIYDGTDQNHVSTGHDSGCNLGQDHHGHHDVTNCNHDSHMSVRTASLPLCSTKLYKSVPVLQND